MKIAIGNDHHGVLLKNRILEYLKDKNIEAINLGSDTEENVDYVDYAIKVCDKVKTKECDLGIVICGSGVGVSITANKIKGIYCGKVSTPEEAIHAKQHDMINVLALAEKVENLEEILYNFINMNYSKEERHIRRVKKIKELENEG